MIDENMRGKLVDFGVCHIMNQGDDEIRATAGSTLFFAPEMCTGEAFRGRGADVWAAAVSLWYMCYRTYPFQASHASKAFDVILTEEPSYPEFMDQELRDLLEKLFKKDPKERITIP